MEKLNNIYKVKFREFNRKTGETELNYGEKNFPTFDDAEFFAFGILDGWDGFNSMILKIYCEDEMLLEETRDPVE